MPTIGQLFPGSLLLVPTHHFDSFAAAPDDVRKDLSSMVDRLWPVMRLLGFPLLIEHGAKRHTGAACGVYHAHAHLIPVPEQVGSGFLLPSNSEEADDLDAAFLRLRLSENYLLFQDFNGVVSFAQHTGSAPGHFSSQYARRRLVQHFELGVDWDWRSYDAPEPALLETMRLFR